MPHYNTLFHEVVGQVPWAELDRAVARHDAAGYARAFSYKSQLVAMIFSQLSGTSSLRAIEEGLQSHANRLYHLGAAPAARTTLADANQNRPAKVFADLLATMMTQVHRQLRADIKQATYLIDSTSLQLSSLSRLWAHFADNTCGAKAHIVYDADADCPIYAAVTPRNVNDITAAQDIPIVPRATYVFDLGYYEYAWWAKLDARQCRIVTRLKKNTPLRVIDTRPVEGANILSDQIGTLPARLSATRANPMDKPVREVKVRIQTGKVLRIVTNDLISPAQDIAAIYKRRWAIELFFRWVKQTLRIKHFIGASENAVRIQIIAALITFLLLRMAQARQTAIASPLTFARLVRANLMHGKALDTLLRPPPRPETASRQPRYDPAQTAMIWNIPALDHV